MNNNRNTILTAIVGVLVVVAGGCTSGVVDETVTEAASPAVLAVVSIAPQAYFVERIGGDLVETVVLAPPDHAPETHQVTPRQMDLLSRADLYFRIGMPFEGPLATRLAASCPQLIMVDTRDGVPMLSMDVHHHNHNHGAGHVCSEDGDDPHIWLDPQRVRIQARTMAEALGAVAPRHASVFRENLAAFEDDLEALHTRLAAMLAPMRGKTVYVFHPFLGYMADAYGFEQRAIEHEGKSPGARRLYALIEEIKAANVPAIFDQPQFAAQEAATIAEATGAKVVLIDNLASDYLDNMERMARAIADNS